MLEFQCVWVCVYVCASVCVRAFGNGCVIVNVSVCISLGVFFV